MTRSFSLLVAGEYAAWGVAFAWLVKVVPAAFGLPGVANLVEAEHDVWPVGEPAVAVIVPARNEERDLRACLESLLGQDYPRVRVVAVDDRSTDGTGRVMEEVAAAHPGRVRVVHVTELPGGWLGKTHAMATAAADCGEEFLLFTDADVVFRADALRRSLAYAVAEGADHLVTAPTPLQKRWDESMMLGFIQIFGLWGIRPWKIRDPRAMRDAMGVGAFNLLRRTAYEQVGGYGALRMEIVEDVGMGRRVKLAGLRSRIAFGRGLVEVHWAAGALGLVNVLTKNVFSALRFSPLLVVFVCGWLLVFAIAPFIGLGVAGLRVPGAITVGAMVWGYGLMRRQSGISAWNALLAPVAAGLFMYAILRSMVVTLRQGGVVWRGTFYPLAELRARRGPLFWWRVS